MITCIPPVVYETGDVLDTYVYRIGLVGRQYSFGAAVGLCRSAVGMILLLTANGVTKKIDRAENFLTFGALSAEVRLT